MRNLALPLFAVAAVAAFGAMDRPPVEQLVEGQAKCGNDICMGSAGTQVHNKGNVIFDRPILPGSTTLEIDGGVRIGGNVTISGSISAGSSTSTGVFSPAVIDAGTIFDRGDLQVAGAEFLTGTLKAGGIDAGFLCVQNSNCATRLIGFVTSAIDFASVTTTCTDSSAMSVPGAKTTDTCTLGMPSTLTSGGTGLNGSYTCYVSAADNIKVRHCGAGTADDPGSVTFTGFVISSQ